MEAVKLTPVPSKIVVPGAATIEMVAAAAELTVIVILLLIAIAGLGQARLLLISQVTTSPFTSEPVVNVEAFVPTFDPLIFHW